ncbi:S8 family serine peptidase [Metaplanococcus flavidus]
MSVYKKIIAGLISAMLVTSTFSVNVFADEGEPKVLNQEETDQVIVTFKDGVKKQMDGLLSAASVKTLGNEEVAVLKVPEGDTIDTYIDELESRNDVEYAEPDHLIDTAYTPNDPFYSYQYHHQNIEVEAAWDKTMGSSDVIVAILDSGFDLNHPDLENQIVFPASTSSTGVSVDNHGTHVAGIIAGQGDNYQFGTGVAPKTSIIPVDVFVGEQAYSSDVITGIYYAVSQGADIINMSIGGYNYNYAYNNAVQYAHQSGVLVIAAAGNDNTDVPMYPASYDNVISVGSTDSYGQLSYFSNYGDYIDVVAPGSFIYSTLPYQSIGSMSGTSMATPVVAGVAALILANEPTLTNDELADRIISTAVDMGSYGADYYYGYGLVNAKQALQIVEMPSPYVYEVYDDSTVVSGYLPYDVQDAKVIVRNHNGVIGALENYSGWHYFDVAIPKQDPGTELYVSVEDSRGNKSEDTVVTVYDLTPPEAPTVNEVTDQSTSVTGLGEVGATISVRTDATGLGSTTVKADGTYSVSIPKQKVGTKLSITATDKAGNISPAKESTVVDGTPPTISLKNKVTHHSTRVIGIAEAASKITVKAGTKLIGTATADAEGHYQVVIAKQNVGTKLSVTATDAAGNSSAPITISVVDGNYPDLKVTHWALNEIMYLGDEQIIGGYPNGKFDPEKNTSRAEAAKMLVTALDLPVPIVSSSYKDVSSKHWAKDYIAAASKAGLFNGNPDGTFAPDKTLKRSEMAKIISIAYEFKASGGSHFKDVKSGYWASGYISGLYENGITTGYSDKTFRAEQSTTRAEFSVFLARALNKDFR